MAINPDPTFRRRRRLALIGVIVAALAVVVVGALVYEHFQRASPPAPAVKTAVTVTIPEGYSRPQAAVLVREDGLRGNYVKASVHSKYLDPAHYGGVGAKNLEGFLFPDTFDLRRHARVSELVQLQLEDFRRRIGGVNMQLRALEESHYLRCRLDRLDDRTRGPASRATASWSPR